MDGGACSGDAFRLPLAGQELSTPFSGFVVRYGHSSRLAKNTATIAGVTAELPPQMEVRRAKNGAGDTLPYCTCFIMFELWACHYAARDSSHLERWRGAR